MSEAWCPYCGHILLWMREAKKNTQECYCGFCCKGYIAIFEEKKIKKKNKKAKIEGTIICRNTPTYNEVKRRV